MKSRLPQRTEARRMSHGDLGLEHSYGGSLMLAALMTLLTLSGCKFILSKELVVDSPSRGKNLVSVYGCVSCHEIDGLSGNPGTIGPPLRNWKQRKFIAGKLPNRPRMLVRWIMNPHAIEPNTAMPDLGITEPEALEIAHYLYSQ